MNKKLSNTAATLFLPINQVMAQNEEKKVQSCNFGNFELTTNQITLKIFKRNAIYFPLIQ